MDFDALIVGSGAGGGTLAYKLAKSGKSVLIIEKGQGTLAAEIGQDEGSMLIQRLVHDDRQLYVNGRVDRLFTGSIAGGGTSLYGAVLLRPSREDFHPGKYYLQRIDQSIWDWTVGYDELKSYYDEAENLYLVAGDSPTETPYLEKRDLPYLGKLPHLEPINQTFQKGLSRQGVNAFRLPLAIDFETCFRCPSCPGYGCPNNSRSSSMNRCIEPAITQFNAKLLTNHEVTKLNSNTSGKVSSISIRDRKSMKLKEFTARHYIVSAGAVGSPALMLRSGIQDKSGQLGRNFMYHAGAIVAGIFTHATGAADRFVKQLGWSDDYLGVRDFKHKLGYVQMLPVPGPLTLQSESPIPIPPNFAKKLHAHSVTFAACVEDLPREDNRIQVHSGGKLTLHHSFSSYDNYRADFALKRLKSLVKGCGALIAIGGTGKRDDLHTAHQVGTARFGDDPAKSVLDRNCRVHGYDNLSVVDGCFMPTSLGVGPALTIIANALRVGDHLIREAL